MFLLFFSLFFKCTRQRHTSYDWNNGRSDSSVLRGGRRETFFSFPFSFRIGNPCRWLKIEGPQLLCHWTWKDICTFASCKELQFSSHQLSTFTSSKWLTRVSEFSFFFFFFPFSFFLPFPLCVFSSSFLASKLTQYTCSSLSLSQVTSALFNKSILKHMVTLHSTHCITPRERERERERETSLPVQRTVIQLWIHRPKSSLLSWKGKQVHINTLWYSASPVPMKRWIMLLCLSLSLFHRWIFLRGTFSMRR